MKTLIIQDGEKTAYLQAEHEQTSYVIACSGTTDLITSYIMGLLDIGYSIQYISVDEFNSLSTAKGQITTNDDLSICAIYKVITK